MYDKFAQAYMKMLVPVEQLNEEVLMEDKIDFLKSKYPEINTSHDNYGIHRKSADVIDYLAQHADPTRTKTYLHWIVKNYHNGGFQQEDAPRVRDTLADFDKYKSKLDPTQRDIGRYNKLSDIKAAIAPHIGTATTKAELKSQLLDDAEVPGKHDKVWEDDHMKIYHIKDSKTSQQLYSEKGGAYPTEWCTAWKDEGNRSCRFDDHNKDGPLFVIHRKSDKEVFQFHPATNQFKDKFDNEIDKNTFKSFEPHLAKAINSNFDLFMGVGK